MISGKLDSPRDFGRYTLTAKIAAGGMATVFRADVKPGDELEGRTVAVKILHDHLADNPEFVRMFKDEGRIVRDLDHPNVVHVYEVGEFQGQHYLAMEFIDGRDLAQVLLAHRLNHVQVPAPLAFEILRQALVALRYVHDYKGNKSRPLGIVHRDVSPQNLLISREPLIKLTDFGIARGDHRSDRTRTGTIKGKMHYMAPEQASGERVDLRADLYAMGAVAYEMLTGQPLFGPGTTEVLHMRAIRGDFEYGPKFERLPDDVKTWLKRCLQTDADRRFQSADAMLSAMEQLAKASRSHYKPDALVKLLDMEDARRSKGKEKAQRLIVEDAIASGRIQPGAVMQAGALPPKVVPTGARVELDGTQRVSRLGHERGDSKVDWNAKQNVQLRPVTAIRDLGPVPKQERVNIRKDLMPAEAAMGKSYAPQNAQVNTPKNAHAEILTPGSLAAPQRRREDDEPLDDNPDTATIQPVKAKAKREASVKKAANEHPGLALASAVAWSCAALLLFAVTQELTGAQLTLPEAQDLRVASLWDDEPQPTRSDAVARSGPHAQAPVIEVAKPKRDVAKPEVRKSSLDATTADQVAVIPLPAVPVRKVAGGVLPDVQVAPEEKQKEAAQSEAAVEHNVERVAWEGRPIEHVERPGMPERGEQGGKPAKRVTIAEAKLAVDGALKVCTLIAGMPNVPAKAKPVVVHAPSVPADAAKPVVVSAKPIVPVAKPVAAVAKPAVAVAKPVAAVAKPVAAVAKPVVAVAKPVVAVAKPVAAVAKPVAAVAKPVAAVAKPVAAVAKPVAAVAKPVVGVAKPVVAVAKPVAAVAKPVVAVAKPVVAAAKPVAKAPAAPSKPAVAGAKPVAAKLPSIGAKPVPAKPTAKSAPVVTGKAPAAAGKNAPVVAKKPAAGQNH
jgi:serine/threonine protein kinase